MTDYSERVCPVCGLSFIPKHKRQIYDKDYCRVKANRESKKGVEAPAEVNWMLEQIRRIDAESALDLEQVAKEVGMKYAERMILIGYRLANRGAIVQAKNVLIESGELKQVKHKQPKASKPDKTTKSGLDALNRKLVSVPALAGHFIEQVAGKGLFLCRMNGDQKETKAFLGTFAKAEKWINETISSGKPNYAALRSN